MSEDTTRHLPSSSEERIMHAIAELRADMNARFTKTDERLNEVVTELAATRRAFDIRTSALEEQAAARTRETRPLWEEVLARVTKIDNKFDVVAAEMLDQRADIEMMKKRLPPAA